MCNPRACLLCLELGRLATSGTTTLTQLDYDTTISRPCYFLYELVGACRGASAGNLVAAVHDAAPGSTKCKKKPKKMKGCP